MKDLLKTKTTWGALTMLLSPIAAGYGVSEGDLQLLLTAIGQLAGFLLTLYGRTVAKDRITSIAGLRIK